MVLVGAPVKGKQGHQTHTLALQLGKMHFAPAHEEDWSPPGYSHHAFYPLQARKMINIYFEVRRRKMIAMILMTIIIVILIIIIS